MRLEKYSLGIGDRFAQQASPQLKAIMMAKERGVSITPVWNKSNREHSIVHSTPEETREAANAAIREMKWKGSYFVDADHINLSNVEKFIESCDFFTIDVAEYIGKPASEEQIERFIQDNQSLIGLLHIPGVAEPITVDESLLRNISEKFLFAVIRAGELYHYIESRKGPGTFITEVSMDEVNEAQTPTELLFILRELARQGIPVDTIAPKFSGRFNKGVDYEGNLHQFEKEFEQDLLVVDYAIRQYELPAELKLSIHSGSDKFSLYPIIGKLMRKHGKGIHVKTAGTTWIEEVIGLAMAGGDSLAIAKNIYIKGLMRYDELCGPYATVINIDKSKLPVPELVKNWTGEKFANSLRHIPGHPDYNSSFRQLIHVSYKVAAEYANIYVHHLAANKELIGKQVTENLYERHIRRLFNI